MELPFKAVHTDAIQNSSPTAHVRMYEIDGGRKFGDWTWYGMVRVDF